MPNLFALRGKGNCGKSDTLIRLFEAIQIKYPAATIKPLHSGTTDIAVIMYGVNSFVVGIESRGDPKSRLELTLSDFAAANCDIIFCACRTRGMTVKWIRKLSSAYNIHFVRQTVVANNYFATNTATVSSLMHQAGI